MAIFLLDTTNGPIDLTTLTTPTTTEYGVCNCGTELSPLIDDKGGVRTTFCEYCD